MNADLSVPTRGERNLNPANIVFNPATHWQGQVGIERWVVKPRFVEFDTVENGIRAIVKILLSYQRQGFDTIAKMIDRWAPPAENDTAAYIADVCRIAKIAKDARCTLDPRLAEILAGALIHHENGRCIYDESVIAAGVASAFAA
jgi:hypothetical protein